MADKQILILVEPTNFEKNATKSQTATWQFGTDFQKKSLQKVLQRSAESRREILTKIFAMNHKSIDSNERSEIPLSRDESVVANTSENHYFQLHNQD